MKVDMEVKNEDEVISKLWTFEQDAVQNVQEKTREYTRELLEEIKDTSPVDTGEYKSGWTTEIGGDMEVFIKNSVEHAKYLVYPNQRMVGSEKADVPEQGITHNVRRIVFEKKNEYEEMLAEAVKEAANRA